MMRKIIITIVVILFLAAGAFLGVRYVSARNAAAAAATAASIQTAPVVRGTITTSILATGSVRADKSTTLSWQTSGTVNQVTVKEGDIVTADQVLATILPESLPQSVILAQADLDNAQKALDDLLNSQVPMVQAKVALESAQKALDDYTYNFPVLQAQAQTTLATAQSNYTTMSNRRAALNQVRASKAQIDAATAAYILAQQAVVEAQKKYDNTHNLKPDDPRRAFALIQLSDAEKKRDAALATLNWYLGKPNAEDIAQADANLAQATADLAQAQYNWDQIKDGPNTTNKQMLQAQVADAQRAYDRIKNGPDPVDVAAARAKVAAAQATLNQVFIKAPFDGVVTDVQVSLGDQASPGQVAFRIDTLARLMLDVQISEVDIANVKVDQPVNMTFDAVPGKTYNGKVIKVAMFGTSTQGLVQFGVTLQFTDADASVKPGMTAAVSIITQRKPNVLIVPNRAIRVQGNQRYVTVMSEGNQVQVNVTVGLVNDTSSEITSDSLKEGDEVVVTAQSTTTTNSGGRGIFGGGGFGP